MYYVTTEWRIKYAETQLEEGVTDRGGGLTYA